MGQILQFPSMNNEGQILKANQEAEQNYFKKIQRINVLNYSQVNDTNMLKQIKGNWEELGRNKHGVMRCRNEDESINCYGSWIQEEKKKGGVNRSNSNEILFELERSLKIILDLRREFWSKGLSVKDSLKVGELKRRFRSLLVYYIKVKENLIEIENNMRKTMAA